MQRNKTQKARHSDSGSDGPERSADVLTHSRSKMGTTRIFRDPFIDGEKGDLPKSRLSKADTAMLVNGYSAGATTTRNEHGTLNLGNMPQLGERTKASKRQTVIKHRNLK